MSPPGLASLTSGLIERARPRGVVDLNEARLFGVKRGTGPSPAARAMSEPGPRLADRPVNGSGLSSRKRYGLTVRVEPELFARLRIARAARGETTQSILHQALQDHLDR